jgi:hypothetical protein
MMGGYPPQKNNKKRKEKKLSSVLKTSNNCNYDTDLINYLLLISTTNMEI